MLKEKFQRVQGENGFLRYMIRLISMSVFVVTAKNCKLIQIGINSEDYLKLR